MQPSEIKKMLARGIGLMGLSPENQPEVLERLALYFQELKKWNSKINLVARNTEDSQVLESHFLDSLSLLSLLQHNDESPETVLDVGTGAGFPGMVLKAACPFLAVTLVEPRKNRYYFLKHIARTLDLKDIRILNVRLEEKGETRELSGRKFSFVTSRAFTDIEGFVRLTAFRLAPGGRIVCMKGPGAEKELAGLFQDASRGMFQIAAIKKFRLPFSKAERALVVISAEGG